MGAGLGDPAAAIVGSYFGGPRLRGKKTVSGTAACFLVAGGCGAGVAISGAGNCGLVLGTSTAQVFGLCGVCVALAELLGDLGGIFGDDNFMTLFGSGCLLSVCH